MATRGKIELLNYLAGAVDCDGHVCIHLSRRPAPSQRFTSPRYSCEIVVTNTDIRLMDLFVETFGGRIYTRRKVKEHHKTTYTWKATGLKALAVARELARYSRIKRLQLEIIIEFYDARPAKYLTSADGWRGRKVLPDEVARRENLYRRLRTVVDDRRFVDRPQRLNEEAPLAG